MELSRSQRAPQSIDIEHIEETDEHVFEMASHSHTFSRVTELFNDILELGAGCL